MRHLGVRHFIHWIVALAILMSALAPAVSQALSISKGDQGFAVEICSANGQKITQTIKQAIEDETTSLPSMGEHCPYCIVQATYLLPTVVSPVFVSPFAYLGNLVEVIQTHRVLVAWLTHPSRAPPSQS